MNALTILCSDLSLGKVDKLSLSQQTLMEIFIAGITNKEKICGPKENPKDISEWKGVVFNGTNEITEMHWYYLSLRGSIELKWLPFSSKDVSLSTNKLQGTIDLTCLPDGLQILKLGSNDFHGTVDLTMLPESLHTLQLHWNKFEGTADFSRLPKSLTELHVSHTKLEGEVFEFGGFLYVNQSNVKDMRHQES